MSPETGKLLILLGIVLLTVGALITFQGKLNIPPLFDWFGNLPLDIRIEREHIRFYFPLGSSLLLSVILSALLYFINKLIR
ncbi:DUF2905 family protein [Prosthecochloris sp. HL-130-GSB]|uniref:DUF2905 family protein n=1 Tax=Prosthecochloris sp. HL-130-GSB TaxID=1974213 RepID=UPI001E33F7F7|nr:DUF2905 family protein [Prosthecochloris sp. HL-130-GSB]